MSAFVDLKGQRFGRLTVLAYHGNGKFICLCDCGTRKLVAARHLKNGATKSCGCMARELAREKGRENLRPWPSGASHPSFKHGHARKLGHSATYRTWCSMIARCENRNSTQWSYYGGRGISIDQRWRGDGGFQRFLRDMGPRPAGTSIDRINNDLGYFKENCRWADRKTQNNNQRRSKKAA